MSAPSQSQAQGGNPDSSVDVNCDILFWSLLQILMIVCNVNDVNSKSTTFV